MPINIPLQCTWKPWKCCEGDPGGVLCVIKNTKQTWLVVWNMAFIFPYQLGIIIPTDFHIFQRGLTTNQYKWDDSSDVYWENMTCSYLLMAMFLIISMKHCETEQAKLAFYGHCTRIYATKMLVL